MLALESDLSSVFCISSTRGDCLFEPLGAAVVYISITEECNTIDTYSPCNPCGSSPPMKPLYCVNSVVHDICVPLTQCISALFEHAKLLTGLCLSIEACSVPRKCFLCISLCAGKGRPCARKIAACVRDAAMRSVSEVVEVFQITHGSSLLR